MSHVVAYWLGMLIGAFVAGLGSWSGRRWWAGTLLGALAGAAGSVFVLLVLAS